MFKKILLVPLLLSAGFAASGVAAVVSAHYLPKPDADVEVKDELNVHREARIVTTSLDNFTSEDVEEDIKDDSELASDGYGLEIANVQEDIATEPQIRDLKPKPPSPVTKEKIMDIPTVPFFSQFADITPVEWRKVGCGIASLAMLIDFYQPGSVSVDALLQKGIASGAYLQNAGWIHAGLIELSKPFGLQGESRSLAHLSMESAFESLVSELQNGPLMVSVHYTFDPNNPIPHLVVVTGVRDDLIYYNDPAESTGGGSISTSKFKSSWKKRYIEIRPIS